MKLFQAFSPESFHLAKRVLRYFKPYRWLIALSFVGMALIAMCTAGTAWLIRPALDDIFINRNENALLLVPLAYIVLTLVKGLSRYGQSFCLNYSGLQVLRTIRCELFEKIMTLPYWYFEKSQVGTLMSHVLNDVGMLQRCLPSVLNVMRQTLTMFALLGVVFYQNATLATVAVVALPVAVLPLLWFSRRLRKYGRKSAQINAELTTVLQEMLSGIRVIKAFSSEKRSVKRFDEENVRMQRLALHAGLVSDLSSPVMELIASFGIALIIWYGGWQVLDGQMTTGAFFSFVAALIMLYDPFKSLNSSLMDMQNALVGAERVFGLLDSVKLPSESGGDVPFDDTFRELEFDNVTFTYDDDLPPALKEASFKVKAGERVALVGPSGAGKTTFVNLIPRFYEATQGRILINGRELKEYKLEDLRKAVAMVSQDAFLFNMSVADNILYGDQQAGKQRMEDAASAAYAATFVTELPEGYETLVGERGTRLSGGQKQRLTIARALIKDAPLLILDEATSALDSQAEKEVQLALENLMEGRTSIVIAHRLSTVINSDRIIVMDKGRILDIGSHAELLPRCELYAKLYALQFKTDSQEEKD